VILLIDNYDSFVHNLARYFQRLGHQTVVVRNDALGPEDVPRLQPSAIVLSPGPCTPREAGCSLQLVRRFHATVPMLGVCLGHQAIAAAFGAAIVRAPEPMHGRVSQVLHDGQGIFSGLPNPFPAGRDLGADPVLIIGEPFVRVGLIHELE
jgi:anthranilate synthase component 2/para-aminobenzoate synthetase component 2